MHPSLNIWCIQQQPVKNPKTKPFWGQMASVLQLQPWTRDGAMTSFEMKRHLCWGPREQTATPWGSAGPLTQEEHSHGWPRPAPGCCPGRPENQQAQSCLPCPASQGSSLAPKLASAHHLGVTRLDAQPASPSRSQLLVTPSRIALLHMGAESSIWRQPNLNSWLELRTAEILPGQTSFREVI
jgi:hypothetical protein